MRILVMITMRKTTKMKKMTGKITMMRKMTTMRKTTAMRKIMKVMRKKRLVVNINIVMRNCTLKMVLN